MDQQLPVEDKKGFSKNDRLLVCSLLAVFGVCILGLLAVTVWGLGQAGRQISANSTQAAGATETVIAHLAEQDRYEYVERFDEPSDRWYAGFFDQDKTRGDTRISIRDGVYFWDIVDTKGFPQVIDFANESAIKDFDVYMDIKVAESPIESAVCSGLFFRRSPSGWNKGAYMFTICNNARFGVHYYGDGGWQLITVSQYERAIQPFEWNRIEVSAHGEHFRFVINNSKVFEMTDDRRKDGNLGIVVTIDKGNSGIVWFDNFGYQSR